jgi:methionine synthase reductase
MPLDPNLEFKKPKLQDCSIKVTESDALPFALDISTSSFKGKLVESREILTNSRTSYFEVHIDAQDVEFAVGDAFGVSCPNPPSLVALLLERLNINGKKVILVESTKSVEFSGIPITIVDIFTNHIDLSSFPRKPFFRILAEYATNSLEKHSLLFLSAAASSEYTAYLQSQRPSILDILNTFSSCNPPLERMLELTKLAPRYYSVLHAPHVNSNLTICFNLVKESIENYEFKGLCSNWLPFLEIGSSVKLRPRAFNNFNFPDNDLPVILICTGTGIVPFVGFIEHMIKLNDPRKIVLLYGHCFSDAESDELFPDLISESARKLDMVIYNCVSRTPGARFKYVYNVIEEGELCAIKDSNIFICGY